MGGGSSGGGDIAFRKPDKEKKTIKNWYNFQQNQFDKFGRTNPLLNAANQGALGFWGQLPSLIQPLQDLQKQVPGFFSGLQKEISGIQGQVPGLQNQLQGIFGGLGGLIGQSQGLLKGLPNVQSLTDPLRGTLGQYTSNINKVFNPVVAAGGALTPQLSRDVAQQTRAIQASQGATRGSGALGTELLNRDAAKDARLANYAGMMNQAAGVQGGLAGQIQNLIGSDTSLRSGLLGQQGQLYGQQQQNVGAQGGLLGLLQGLTGAKAGLFGQQGSMTQNLASGQQGLQTGGLNQLLGTLGSGVSAYGGLTNPILGYLGNLFQGNLQGSIANSQIQAQQQAAGDAKMGSSIGGAISAIGSIAPLLFMSDERTKTKMKDTGLATVEGVPLKTWEYKTRPGVKYLSATAQDIERQFPDAVVTEPLSGIKLVDAKRFPIMQISAVKPTEKAA